MFQPNKLCDESTMILNVESQNQLNKQHNDLLRESSKLILLKKVLLEHKEMPKRSEEIALALKIFRASEYLRLENETLLHLDADCSNINLSYNAQKELQKILWQALQRKFQTISPFIKMLKEDFPQLLDKTQKIDLSLPLMPADSAELLRLDVERRDCLLKVAEIHNRKLKLLKAAAEIKLDTSIADKIEIMHLDLCANQAKANLFRDYMINEFVNSSEHTVKAIKLIEKNINELIDQADKDEVGEKKLKI